MIHFSGGPIADFITGWAIIPFRRNPHHWKQIHANLEGEALYQSKCGLKAVTTNGVQPLGIGNFTKCRKCLAATVNKA
ncbi:MULTISPECIES: hypothetical protein [unclassified Methylophaga]|uniref:hypothetical protein n=1 Tax=unclassified Methylophaga TaxID=2629249 RepID=UPI000C96D75B|nr:MULTISPECIES: hypothetical protein [unclassified Methylophaga]MBN46324.1 hypothetical protein [Methylophaga sp.]|tara:strand:+ start:64340 stop:64573 length:234 start_codon:yes stop_codon:yes gene_type:complete